MFLALKEYCLAELLNLPHSLRLASTLKITNQIKIRKIKKKMEKTIWLN